MPIKEKSDEEIQFGKRLKISSNDEAGGRFCVSLPLKIEPNTLENNRLHAINRDRKLMKQLSTLENNILHAINRDRKLMKQLNTLENNRLHAINRDRKLMKQLSNLENNRLHAINRDRKLMKQLSNRGIKELFDAQIKEMVETGILRKVDDDHPKRYLPLLAVINMEKESTKVRVCLDAKSKYRGLSFNAALFIGKLETMNIMEIITQFRSGKFAISGDIRKMFWQILLDKYDEPYHGIICEGETYVFTRISFGGTPSPNIADECMLTIAKRGEGPYPAESKVIREKRCG